MASTSPALRYALALWIVIGVAASIRTVLHPDSHTVFPVFAGAGVHWWADQPLYANYRPVDYFRYSPSSALFFSFFAAFGYRIGGVLWLWLGLSVYASGISSFHRDVLRGCWTTRRELMFFTIATAGALAGLWNGQSNALIVGLLLWGVAALASGRDLACSIWLALAVSVKLTALPLVLLFCALWPRKLALRLVLACIVFGFVPFLTRPPAIVLQHYSDWVAQQGALASERWPGFRDAWTVWQVLEHTVAGDGQPLALTAPLRSSGYRIIQLISAVCCLAWCAAQRWTRASERQLMIHTLNIGSAWILLFGPAVEFPTYVFLAPLLAAAVVDGDAPVLSRSLAIAATGLILTFGWGATSLTLAAAWPCVLTALPVGTALFAVGQIWSALPRFDGISSPRQVSIEAQPLTSAAA
jgi:hypothetical protein